MKTIAFFNNKGGVAKTTSVINVAYILAEVMHKSVMIIDCDGQQNASRFFTDVIPEYGIEEALLNTRTTLLSAFSHTRYENIDIVCSTQKMNDCSKEFEQLTSEIQQMNLNKIKQFSSDYDYVLLDLPPALNCLTEKILGITDSVIVPVELGTFAIQGVAKVTDTINRVGSSFTGCFVSKFDKNNKAESALHELLVSTLGNKVFDTVIPYSNIIKNSIAYKLTAYEYMHWLNPSKQYVALTEEIIRKVG